MSLVLIILIIAVEINDLTSEGVLVFQIGLRRWKKMLFNKWVRKVRFALEKIE